jgi:DNA polymerase-1
LTERKYRYNDYSFYLRPNFDYAAVDLETTGLDPKKDKICFLSLCFQSDEAWVFSWPMKEGSLGWLMDWSILKVFHNAKFDIAFLEREGYVVNKFTDTQLMAYHIDNCNSGRDSSLKVLAKKFLGVEEATTFKDLFPKGKNKDKTILDVPIEKVIPYSGDDAIYTYGLCEYFTNLQTNDETGQILDSSENLRLDIKCSTIIRNMVKDGCKINVTKLLRLQSDCGIKLSEYASILRKWIPDTVNLGSPKQMQDLLYWKWQLPIVEFTDAGGFSVDDDALKLNEKRHPAIPFLREYRFYKKLQSTYLEPFAEYTKIDGFLYGSFNQTATITGRLSSSDPNLQNIPVRHELGKELRKCWISRFPQGKLIVADHSQIEMRVMAHFSQDKALIKAIIAGEDLHTATAKVIFGTDEPTGEQRSVAKTINFGTIYGMGVRKLAISLGIPLMEATEYLQTYFNVYRGVKDYMLTQQEAIQQNGYVETLLGRRLNVRKYDYAGTRAVNYPIQGSAAEIIKLGMIQMAKFICSQGNRAKLILQVHDELVIDCPPEDVDVYEKNTEEVMLEDVPQLKVPLAVTVKVVDTWGDAKE